MINCLYLYSKDCNTQMKFKLIFGLNLGLLEVPLTQFVTHSLNLVHVNPTERTMFHDFNLY